MTEGEEVQHSVKKVKKKTVKWNFIGIEEVQYNILDISQYKKALSNDTPDWLSPVDRDWEPNHQHEQYHLPKPNLRKPPENPHNIIPTLNTLLRNIDDPETPSSSAKYNIAPVRKIKLTKKGQRDTGSPPISIVQHQAEYYV